MVPLRNLSRLRKRRRCATLRSYVLETTMNIVKLLVLGATSSMLLSVACATSSAETSDAPDTELDALEESDIGTDYNGWNQDPNVAVNVCGMGPSFIWQNLNRSYGDATRGGGVCLVALYGTACSTDSECHASATAGWGPSVWGYCYSGFCYARPGSQADYCTLNPNRAPGQLFKFISPSSSNFALGCMTKTAGPNMACAGTNTSLYMRTLREYVHTWDGCEMY
jgi:hypothetical protein